MYRQRSKGSSLFPLRRNSAESSRAAQKLRRGVAHASRVHFGCGYAALCLCVSAIQILFQKDEVTTMQTTTCRAHDRNTGQPCNNPPLANTGLCAQHGGKAV